tara:strand:- start:300 stop:767 length:468 start_codon:yes stop_codon:yes gene_type:complete
MKDKDQNLIFEAYAETLNEDWKKGTSKAPKGKSFDMSRGGAPSNVDAASDGSGGRYRKTRPPSAPSKKTHGEMEEEDNNDQYAPEEAPADDQLGGMEPLDTEGDEAEENSSEDIAKALQDIVGELKTLNQYADFMSTGTRAQGFTGGVQKQKGQL